MKQYFYAALIVFLTGCAGDSSGDHKDSTRIPGSADAAKDSVPAAVYTDSGDTARNADDTVVGETDAPKLNLITVKFKVYFTTSYCGGAKPSEEIIAQHETPRLLTSSNIKLKEHFTGVVYTLPTNASGEGEAELEAGKYDIYLTQNINAALNTGFDPKCSLWVNKPLQTIKVSDNGKIQELTVHFECNPCDENSKKRP